MRRTADTLDGRPPGERGGDGLTALLRYSHIFASTVRELLELKILREASPAPLSLSQFHLLKLMAMNGRHQVGEVADFLGVSAPAATKNIDKLQRLGLVHRARAEQGDRRATFLNVSPAGRALVKRYERLKLERLAPVLDEFETRELEQLASLLQRFAVRLLEAEPSDDGMCLRCAAYIESGCAVSAVRGGCPYQRFHTAAGERTPADTAGDA